MYKSHYDEKRLYNIWYSVFAIVDVRGGIAVFVSETWTSPSAEFISYEAARRLFHLLLYVAEGPIYVLGLLPMLWKHIKLTLFFALSELSGGAVLQLLKALFDMPRPASAFENCPDMVLPVVEGVNMHHSNSFPSGHASTFFVFCTCYAIFLAYHHHSSARRNGRKSLYMSGFPSLLLLLLAALGAYSRVYLSQHFLSDVCVGSLIGFITPCLLFYFGKNKIQRLQRHTLTSGQRITSE